MASPLPPGIGSAPVDMGQLAGPPPNPVNNSPQPQGDGGFGGVPGTPVQPPADQAQTAAKFLVSVGAEIDRALATIAQAAPAAGQEFSQARQLIQVGIAKVLQGGPGAVSATPTATGPNFTGVGQ
jgi:hypothetical protein